MLKTRELNKKSILKKEKKIFIGSSSLTILSSYHMTKLLREKVISEITAQIQILTIITSFLVDYIFNKQSLSNSQIMGVFFMVGGIVLSNKKNDINTK